MPGELLAQNRCSVNSGSSCVMLVKMLQPTGNLLGVFSNLNDFLILLAEILGVTEPNPFKPTSLLISSVVARAMSLPFFSVLCSAKGGC